MSDQLIDRKFARYKQLLNGIQKESPRLYDVLDLLSTDVKNLLDVVDPIKATVESIVTSSTIVPGGATSFLITKTPTALILTWPAGDANVRFYEVRKGTDWATAEFVIRTSSLSAAINPLPAGTYTFLLKTLSGSLVESANAISAQITLYAPEEPVVSAQAIDNTVAISWTVPYSDFAIAKYNVYKDGVKFAEVNGTFTTKFEVVAGTYTYGVEAVNIIGDIGFRGETQATLRQAPDYNLLDTRNSTFTGTLVNCYVNEEGKLVACVDLTEQYETHFTSKSWANPQDQVTAGFDRYIQENLLTGSYTEDYDYGTTISNVIVNYNYLKEIFAVTGDVSIVIKTYHKMLVGDAWTGPITGPSAFIASFRYLRSVLEFTTASADAMITVASLVINLDVKREVDSGFKNALASDTTGTVVTFNKTFKDIDSINATSDSGAPVTVIVDFTDIQNPTSFKVLCFDSSGNRIDQTIYWVARGIV